VVRVVPLIAVTWTVSWVAPVPTVIHDPTMIPLASTTVMEVPFAAIVLHRQPSADVRPVITALV